MTHKKFGPDRFSRFDVYWIQTNKQTNRQTDKQTDKPNLYIDREHCILKGFRSMEFVTKVVASGETYEQDSSKARSVAS